MTQFLAITVCQVSQLTPGLLCRLGQAGCSPEHWAAMAHLPLRTALGYRESEGGMRGYRDSTASLGTLSATSNGDLIGASDDEALDAYDRARVRACRRTV